MKERTALVITDIRGGRGAHGSPAGVRGRRPRCPGLVLLLLCAVGCSSAPKGPAEVRTMRNLAESQLEMVNQAVDRGDYAGAETYWAEVWRLAVSTDDPALRVRAALARGNILACQNQGEAAEAVWEEARIEAERVGEPDLAAMCRLYQARNRLLSGAAGPGGPAEAIRDQAAGELRSLKDEKARTLALTVLGLAEKELGRWDAAEGALRSALDTHQKGRSLEAVAYDWYLIASVRSVAGRYAAAREALEAAIALDRRAENSYGLWMDWRALGEVYAREGNQAEATRAQERAAAIRNALTHE